MGACNLTIDLDAIAENWRRLDAMSAATTQTAGVIKADAYGLGTAPVAHKLASIGVRTFFVALPSEGAILRDAIGDAADIFVFSGYMADDHDIITGARLIPLLNSPEQVAAFAAALPGQPCGLQLDTGMNRLGIEPGDLAPIRDTLASLAPQLCMSHLACADEPDHAMNAVQLAAFTDMVADLPPMPHSLAATGGTLLGPAFHFDMTRPGVGLYGGQPFAQAKPVVTLDVPVIQTRAVAVGETVGYGNAWTAQQDSIIATIAAGYADGLHRALGAGLTVFAGDIPCPVIGRVSMDLFTVDVTHLDAPPTSLSVLNRTQTVDDLADVAGTIGYEILTSLGARYNRIYAGAA